MNALRWQRMKGIYFEALELSDERREAFLDETCGDDDELRGELERLLLARGRLGGFLEHPDGGSLARRHAAVPPSPVRRLDDFELLEEIGCGAMGRVYRARQESLDRIVAVKVMQPSLTLSARQVAQFRLEATAAARLRHPNVVSVHAVGEMAGVHYYAMDHIAGPSLERVLEGLRDERAAGEGRWHRRFLGGTSLTYPARAAQVAAELAEALQYSHERGVVHRDVKPGNVLLDEAGRPQLTDFGLAKDLELESLYHSGRIAGTPYYMSPEQARSTKVRVDHRSDIFSLGVVLYELLTLERPFQGETSHDVFRAIQHAEPRAIRRINGRVPADLETICLKAVEKDPARRYQHARDLAQDLRRFLSHESISARPPSVALRAGRLLRRHRLALTLSIVVIGALAAGVRLADWWRASSVLAGERARAERVLADPGATLQDLVVARDRLRYAAEWNDLSAPAAALAVELDHEIEERGSRHLEQGVESVSAGMLGVGTGATAPGAELGHLLGGVEHLRIAASVLRGERAVEALERIEGLAPRVDLRVHGAVPSRVEAAPLDPGSGKLGEWRALEAPEGDPYRLGFGTWRLRASAPGLGIAERSVVLTRPGAREEVELWLRPREEVTADMLPVPAGEFVFGEGTQGKAPFYRRVETLPAFWIDRTEVSNADYKRFVDETGHPEPELWMEDGYRPEWADLPVVGVSFHDAGAFAAWAGKRLPTAFEWQRAARGTEGLLHPWGDEPADPAALANVARPEEDLPRHSEHLDIVREKVRRWARWAWPVDDPSSDVSPVGAFHMLGNVREWTETMYLTRGSDGSLVPTDVHRIAAGSSFRMATDRPLTTLDGTPIGMRDHGLGFRCARSLEP